MSLNRIQITNFQSLRQVNLDLGMFTVIVGPSSSGKSALIRAFKALASNVRGNSMITRGAKMMTITAHTDTHVITLDRADRVGNYRLTPHGGETAVYAKLGGAVPEQITAALRIEPVSETGSVNFASQFDRPYLLDESGAAVARELGALTKVNQIFEAVRTANRIRAQAASTLKTRKADLELLRSRLSDYTGLAERLEWLEQAETLDQQRQRLQRRLEALEAAINTVERACALLATTVIPVVPEIEQLSAQAERWRRLTSAIRDVELAKERAEIARRAAAEQSHELAHAEFAFSTALIRAGECPTCGQRTSERP